MRVNAAARHDPSAGGWVRLPILIAALLLVAGMVLSVSGLAGTAHAQAERGAITSLNLTSNEPGQLVITWETPDPAPTDYRLTWAHASLDFPSYTDGNVAEGGNVYPAGDETTLTLNDLTPGEEYKVQIRARYYNEDRSVHEWSGPWTEVATQRVKNHPPAEPTGLIAARVGHDSLTLTWDDPQDARITGYRVMRGTDAGSLSTIEADTGSASTEYTDTTVAPETTYFYAVLALSPDGDGAPSTALSVTTPAEPTSEDQTRDVVPRQNNNDQSVTLVSNLTQSEDESVLVSRDHGQAFTTGVSAGGYTVTGVTMISEDVHSDLFALQICEVDSSVHPTTACTDLTAPPSFAAGTLVFNAPTNPALTLYPNTTYMLVFKGAHPDRRFIRVDATTEDSEDASSLPGWSIRNVFQQYSSTGWQDGGESSAIRITITGRVNTASTTAPAASNSTVTAAENTPYTFTAADFNFTARTPGDTLASVRILTLPARGTLTLAGAAVTANQAVTKAELDAGRLVYTPAVNSSGTRYARFTFRVSGSTEASTLAYRMTIDVTGKVSVSKTSLPIPEGSSGTYTIVLTKQPTADVTVIINDPTNTDVTAEPASLTFTTNNWNSLQMVTVSVTDDDDTANETATVTHTVASIDSNYNGASANDVDISVWDNERVGFFVQVFPVTIKEGRSHTYTYLGVISGRPTHDVIVTVNLPMDYPELTADPTTLTFTPDMWNTPQEVTLTVAHDDDWEDETVTVTHTVVSDDETQDGLSGGRLIVNVIDDDNVTVSFGAGAYTVAEGGMQSVTVTLSADARSTAVIPLTMMNQNGATDADYSGVPTSVTFSTGETEQTISFEAIQDDVDDDGESVVLSFGALPSGVSAGTTAATTVSIDDDDDPRVTVMFGAGAYTVAEGGTQSVTVSLSADPERTVVIPLTATPRDGATAADYAVEPTSVTFDSGEMSQTIDFTATQDDVDDDGESVQLGFGTSLPDRVSAGTPNQATVNITDDDGVGVTVSETSLTIGEGSSGTYTIVLDSQPTADVTVTINDPSGSTDVTAEPASLTFTDTTWNTAQTVTVSAAQDDDAADETATVTHSVSSTDSIYGGASANSVVVSVTDDDDPRVTVMFGAGAYTVAEGGTQSVTVSLSADPERTVVIPLTATPRDGATAADYTVPTSVTFNAGDMSQTIDFTATQDEVDDDDESVRLGFGTSLPDRVSAGTPNQVTFSITDDDDPRVTVMFGAGAYTVLEGGTQSVTVSLSADPERTVIILLTATPQGTATSADYTVPTSVTFNRGETEQTISFEAIQDDVDDDGESVQLGFGTLPSRVSAGTPNQVIFSIDDDDDPRVTVMFGAGAYTVAEGGMQSVTVSLSADPERTVIILLTATPQGTATSADYTVPTSVTFSTGETEQTISFEAIQDDVDDDGESVQLGFGTLPSGVSAGTTAATTVSIDDDDDPRVTVMFGAGAYTVAEGGTQSVTVSLSADPERTVVIPLTATPRDGATAADYAVEPTSVTFDSGEMSQTIDFTATQDDVDDDGESVQLGFGTSLPDRVSAGTPNQATVNITDDDGVGVTVSETSLTIGEGSSGMYTIVLDSQPTADVTVTINDPSGSTDVTAEPASLTFTDTTWNTAQTVTVSAAQDDDAADETATVTHSVSSTDSIYGGASANSVVVSVTDDDDPRVTVMFGAGAYTVAEGGTQSVTVSLSADPERTVVIPLTATPRDGATAADYTVPTSVTFNAGDMSQTIDFTATQDEVDDDDESVRLGFGTSLPDRVSAGTPNQATVNITDDDDPRVTVMFGAGAYTVLEGGTQSVTVSLSADPERTVIILLTATPQGTATSADYTVPTSVTFNRGETEQTISFEAIQDDVDDDGESVQLGFGTLPSRVSAGTPNQVIFSIDDDDDPRVTVMFGAGAYTVAEGGMQSVTVSLSADPERTVIILLTATPQGTATSADYTVPTSVTFSTGETEQTISFEAIQDDVDDDGESVQLGFGTLPSRVSAGTPNHGDLQH